VEDIKFPLTYRDDDGSESTIESLDELGVTVEFADDYDPEYFCRDVEGKRVRLAVWGLGTYLAQVVPNDFAPELLEVKEFSEGEYKTMAESFRDEVLRVIKVGPGKAIALQGESLDSLNGSKRWIRSMVTPSEFHTTWMKALVGRKYK